MSLKAFSNSEPNIAGVDHANHANSDPNSTNDLETAKHNLETYATVHNVQGDGNCLYNFRTVPTRIECHYCLELETIGSLVHC